MWPLSSTRTRITSSRCTQSKANKQQLERNFKQQLRVERNNGHVGTKYVIWLSGKRLGKNQECFHFRFLLIIIVWRRYGKIFIRSFRFISVVCFFDVDQIMNTSFGRKLKLFRRVIKKLKKIKVTCKKCFILIHENTWINNRRFKVELFALIHPWNF